MRLITTGYEQGFTASYHEWSDTSMIGSPEIQSACTRSGQFALRCNDQVGNVSHYYRYGTLGAAVLYTRLYLYVSGSYPSGTGYRAYHSFFSGSAAVDFVVSSSGRLHVYGGGFNKGGTTSQIPLNTWVLVRHKGIFGGTETSEFVLDALGETVTITSYHSGSGTVPIAYVGTRNIAGTVHLYIDDVAINDGTGAYENTYPNSGSIIVLKPISDNSIGSWINGASGSTNLYDAINNRPPIVTGGAETATTNIAYSCSVGAGTQSSASFNFESYSTVGIQSYDTINLIQGIVRHGEHEALNAKTGRFSLISNPASSVLTSFTFGGPGASAAHSAETGSWRSTGSEIQYVPSVTLNSSPVAQIIYSGGGDSTNVVCCDFMGITVDYTPGVAPSPPVEGQSIYSIYGIQNATGIRTFSF